VTRFDKLFLGVAVERPPWIPATIEGIEHIGPEDTFDGDYGRLLEAAQNRGKGLASLSTPSWNQIMVWLREMAELRESGVVAA
jgi:hypothetical protein